MIARYLKPELIMDDQLLLSIYHRLFDNDSARYPAKCVYSDSVIALIHVLGVLHDRSMRWAHKKTNWPLWMRRLKPPGYSQLMRRLQAKSVRLLIATLNLEFRRWLPNSTEKFCD